MEEISWADLARNEEVLLRLRIRGTSHIKEKG
jgi:hypothetical protein